MPNGARKGSAFEREICKKLSLWWTNGKRDDVFWRSSQSGGRATTRAKQGKTTAGSYGDICALDPIGAPLLEAFTIELKRGKSGGFPGDVIDLEFGGKNPWIKTVEQVRRARKQAGSKTWMIIAKRDRRLTMIYMPAHVSEFIPEWQTIESCVLVRSCGMRIFGCPLDSWLERILPKDVKAALEEN